MKLAEVQIDTPNGSFPLTFEAGKSTLFIGANGAGKTRLGVLIENGLADDKVRRVAAHRSLTLSDTIVSIGLERALRGLAVGYADQGGSRLGHRWQGKPAVSLLSDYDFLLQALFAQQNRTAVEHLEKHRDDPNRTPPLTVLSRLKAVWERLLPDRALRLLELGIEVLPPGAVDGAGYPASEMSDGERVIFYLLGHCLLAPEGAVIIIDEPELHIHKAIIGRLWDAIEAERPDCAFVYITHDLDFVVARPTATKLNIRSFTPPKQWDIEPLPEETGLPDRVVSELVGSRQPVLFVEGDRGSIDATIYRCAFPSFLVEPIGSCEAVIHAVASFRSNGTLHRVGEVRGCVDADAREAEEIAHLREHGIHVLPVAEVENVLLLPGVFVQLAKALELSEVEAAERLQHLTTQVMSQANNDLESASIRYAVRRLDAELKRLAPGARSMPDLTARLASAVAALDPGALAGAYRSKLAAAIAARDLRAVLMLYDNKGLLSFAAQRLGLRGKRDLTEFAGRLLSGERGKETLAVLQAALPNVVA